MSLTKETTTHPTPFLLKVLLRPSLPPYWSRLDSVLSFPLFVCFGCFLRRTNDSQALPLAIWRGKLTVGAREGNMHCAPWLRPLQQAAMAHPCCADQTSKRTAPACLRRSRGQMLMWLWLPLMLLSRLHATSAFYDVVVNISLSAPLLNVRVLASLRAHTGRALH